MGRSEALCCSESKGLPFLLKYLPLNGISSSRQQLTAKDKQVGMGEGDVSGAEHGWNPPAAVAVLWPHVQKAGWAQSSPKMCPYASSDRETWVS